MIRYLIALSLLIFFSGCNQSATSVFKKDPLYGQYLQYTKILKIIKEKDEVDSLFNITYLNSANKDIYNINGDQNFLIGLYDNNKSDLNHYLITLDGKSAISIGRYDLNSAESSNIPFKNRWANYHIVKFNQQSNEKLKLKIKQIETNKELEVIFNRE